MRERLLGLARALASLAALVALLAGPPLALIRFVGNPLPEAVPDLGQITDALTRTGVEDRTVIKILALLAWIIWVQIAAAVASEVAGQIRSRPALSVPALPGIQLAAQHLVAGVVLIAVVAGSGRTTATAAAFEPHPVTFVAEGAGEHDVDHQTPPASKLHVVPEYDAQPTAEHVVQRHESLWSIAETVLGDGFRWREIRDLNIGTPQPGGGQLTDQSDVIHPGWVLLVPAPQQTSSPSPPPATHTVQRGEHLWQIAEDTLEGALQRDASDDEIDPYWRELVEVNRSELPDPGNPSLLHSGHTLRLPDVPGAEPSPEVEHESVDPAPTPPEGAEDAGASEPIVPSTATTVSPPPPSSTTTPTTRVEQSDTAEDVPELDEEDEQERSDVAAGLLGVAGTGLAAAVALSIVRRRRDRQARATPGHVVPPTPEDLRDLHQEVVARADFDKDREIHAALGEVALHVSSQRRGRCRPRLVQADAERIDVLLDDPDANPPPGWTAEASGEVWTRPRNAPREDGPLGVAPMLVSLGRPDPATELLYDLEAAGCTSLSGDPDAIERLLRSLLAEIVHRPDEVVVAAVGDVPAPAGPAVRRVEAWEDLADEALGWAQLSADALAANKLDSAFLARGSGRSIDGTVPMLVICDETPEDDRFDELLEFAAHGAAVAVVVVSQGPARPGTNVHLDGQRLVIPSFGLDLDPQGIDAHVADDLDALIEAADAPAQPPELTQVPETPSPPAGANGQPYVDPDHDVLVRVLGQIEAEGGREPLKPKQLGLLTYIATHPGCSAEQVEDALWPDPIETRRHRLHITLSQVRSAIGSHHLPPFDDQGSYRVADTVRTDLDLFDRRIQHAERGPSDEARPILRGALELVTGPPFSYNARGRQSFSWVDTEHWISMTEAAIVKAAWDLWQLCIDDGDHDGAVWAARRGLLASPTNTGMTNCLLRAYAEQGDISTAERVYQSHVRALDRLDLGDPEDSTIDLWEELSKQPAEYR